jgi:Leucine-rich repeat (LRR) protein
MINELKDIEKNNFKFIEYLDLSYNKIVDINNLEKAKFKNISVLFLSFNEIKDCDVFSIMSLNKLYKLDLSNNRIEKIEVNKLLENLGYNCSKLLLNIEKDDIDEINYNLLFQYSSYEKYIIFNHLIKVGELYNFLKNLCFKNIQNLTLEGINCLELLENESLKELKYLDIKIEDIEDLSIFDKIHFFDIREIKLGSNIIKKGFTSLKIFQRIKTKKIKIEKNDSNSFFSSIELENPKIYIDLITDNLEFLNNNILNGIERI